MFNNFSGYFSVAKETYDISWTMPHCVMCLRLIGLAMDVHDGQKKPVETSFKI
jgi:lysophospholipid acyltransferase 5